MDSSFFRKGAGRTACALALSSTMVLPLLPAQAADAPTPATSPSSPTAEATPAASEQVTPLATEPVDSIPAMKDTPAATEEPASGEPVSNTEQPATHSIELDADGIDMSQPTVTLKGIYYGSLGTSGMGTYIALRDKDSQIKEGHVFTHAHSYTSSILDWKINENGEGEPNGQEINGRWGYTFELTIDTELLSPEGSYQLVVFETYHHGDGNLLSIQDISLSNSDQVSSVIPSDSLQPGIGQGSVNISLKNYSRFTNATADIELLQDDIYPYGRFDSSSAPKVLSSASLASKDLAQEQVSFTYDRSALLYSQRHFLKMTVRNEQGEVINTRYANVTLAPTELSLSTENISVAEDSSTQVTVKLQNAQGYHDLAPSGYAHNLQLDAYRIVPDPNAQSYQYLHPDSVTMTDSGDMLATFTYAPGTLIPGESYDLPVRIFSGHQMLAEDATVFKATTRFSVPSIQTPVTPEPKPEKQAPKLTAESTHLQQYGYNTFAFELANAADYREGANFVKFQLIGTAEDGSERTFLSDGLTLPELDSDGLATAVYHFENSDLVPGYSYRLQVQWVHGGYHSEPLASESFDLVAPESQAYATELAWAQKHQVIPVHDRVLDPKVNVSTADMALALYSASGSPEVQLPAASPYLDVSADNSEQYRAIVWASQQRLVDAPNGRFYPARAVSRATLAAALYRLDHEVKQPDNSERGYFGTEISWAFDQNLVPLQMSMTEREFGPRLALTRADLAGFLYRWNALHPVFVD